MSLPQAGGYVYTCSRPVLRQDARWRTALSHTDRQALATGQVYPSEGKVVRTPRVSVLCLLAKCQGCPQALCRHTLHSLVQQSQDMQDRHPEAAPR